MNVDCQWLDERLEALACGRLDFENTRLAREHLDECSTCRREMQALQAVDPLVKSYFERQLAVARLPSTIRIRRVAAVAAGAVSLAIAIGVGVLQHPRTISLPATAALQRHTDNPDIADAAPDIKIEPAEAAEAVERAKPSSVPGLPADVSPVVGGPTAPDAPEFRIADPAGYSHTLEDYRGYTVVVGVWSAEQPEAAAGIERLYQTFGRNPRIRFLGVSSKPAPKPAGTTFPVAFNEGSKLFGAMPGEFVVLDENGVVEQRGSLVKNLTGLQKTLQSK